MHAAECCEVCLQREAAEIADPTATASQQLQFPNSYSVRLPQHSTYSYIVEPGRERCNQHPKAVLGLGGGPLEFCRASF